MGFAALLKSLFCINDAGHDHAAPPPAKEEDIARSTAPSPAPASSKESFVEQESPPVGVTFTVAKHGARPVDDFTGRLCKDVPSFWEAGNRDVASKSRRIISTSITAEDLANVVPMRNGFVSTLVEAYSNHQAVILRPDDIWIAILSQLNLYVNAHAEELRSHFVDHEGQKELKVFQPDATSIEELDIAWGAGVFSSMLKAKIKDPEFYGFVMPNFSTSTYLDRTTASMFMMSTLQRYFSYSMICGCGLPSVTLLGQKSDYESIEARMDKLASLGAELADWVKLLRPVLKRITESFDTPSVDFWSRIFREEGNLSGPHFYTGWIVAFCPFTLNGKWQLMPYEHHWNRDPDRPVGDNPLVLDGVMYPHMHTAITVSTSCQVPIKLQNPAICQTVKAAITAGILGARVTGDTNDTMQPFIGWILYEQKTEEEVEAEKSH